MTVKELERKWHRDFSPRYSPAQLLKIFPEARAGIERELKLWIEFRETFRELVKDDIEKASKETKDDFSEWFWMRAIENLGKGETLEIAEKRIRTLKSYLRKEDPKGSISDDDIRRAKEYPFEELIKQAKVYGKGRFMAICPFHDDRHPSFYVKNNFGYCFSCGKSVDTIAFVMETEGLDFISAVKRLI